MFVFVCLCHFLFSEWFSLILHHTDCQAIFKAYISDPSVPNDEPQPEVSKAPRPQTVPSPAPPTLSLPGPTSGSAPRVPEPPAFPLGSMPTVGSGSGSKKPSKMKLKKSTK